MWWDLISFSCMAFKKEKNGFLLKGIVSQDKGGVLTIPWHRWGCAVILLAVLNF
jgi:hypothetical protein